MSKESNSSNTEKVEKNNHGDLPEWKRNRLFDWLFCRHICATVPTPEMPSRRKLKNINDEQDALLTMMITGEDATDKMLRALQVSIYKAAADSSAFAARADNFDHRSHHLDDLAKLVSTYVKLDTARIKRKGKSEQKVTVEHIYVGAGGQAAIGAFETTSRALAPRDENPKQIAAPNEHPITMQNAEVPGGKEPVNG